MIGQNYSEGRDIKMAVTEILADGEYFTDMSPLNQVAQLAIKSFLMTMHYAHLNVADGKLQLTVVFENDVWVVGDVPVESLFKDEETDEPAFQMIEAEIARRRSLYRE